MYPAQLFAILLLIVQVAALPFGHSILNKPVLPTPVRIPISSSNHLVKRDTAGPPWGDRRPGWGRPIPPTNNEDVAVRPGVPNWKERRPGWKNPKALRDEVAAGGATGGDGDADTGNQSREGAHIADAGAERGRVGTQEIVNRRNTMYTIPVNIGTPPQTLEVQLDTGSNGLWVHSNTCQKECPRQPGFDRRASSTYNTTGAGFRAHYVVTHIYGEVGTDTISFGGYTVPEQEFGVALDAKGTGFKDSTVVGIIGMGWPIRDDNKFPSTTPWWVHALQGKGGAKWPKPMFGIALRATDDGKPQGPVPGGQLTLGGVDGTSIQGGEKALKWMPVDSSNAWEVLMDDLVVGGSSVLRQDQGRPVPSKANLDTGTAGLMGPFAAVAALYARIPGSFVDEKVSTPGKLEYYRYPCDAAPEVDVTFSGVPYPIAPEDMWQYRDKHNASSSGETCLGNIFGWSQEKWIIGGALFHSAYVAFQYDPPAIGIGKLV